MYLIMSEALIKNNWFDLKDDPCFPCAEMESAQELIDKIKAGETVRMQGFKVVIQNQLPSDKKKGI